MSTKIEWCDETINPLGWGCYGPYGMPEAPEICEGCYAHRIATGPRGKARGCDLCAKFVPHWHGNQIEKVTCWKKHRAIFWQDMGDLFHAFTPYGDISACLETAIAADQHTHIFLTKNPQRYLEFTEHFRHIKHGFYGVTVRNQYEADTLVPKILKLAAMGFKVFISYEPAWELVDFTSFLKCARDTDGDGNCPWHIAGCPSLSGIIAGGQTGPGARPAHPDWFRSVRDQCAAAGVPFFFKGWGEWHHSSQLYDLLGTESGDAISEKIEGGVVVHDWAPSDICIRVGKKLSGRLLDGREHNDLPWKVKATTPDPSLPTGQAGLPRRGA